jgi:xanthine dehydrogenase YagT iron-sulfur-binding subunit
MNFHDLPCLVSCFQPLFDETIMTEKQQEDSPDSTGPDSNHTLLAPRSIPSDTTLLPSPDTTPEKQRQWLAMPQISRRGFLAFVGAGSAVGAVSPGDVFAAEPAAAPVAADSDITRLTVNGVMHEAKVDVRTTLLDYLREDLQLTGTKKGCDHGQCGACTVHVNGRRINSCLSLVAMHDGDSITTIEGLGTPDNMHPMQAAFVEHDGLQCGYCTAGQIMSAVALLKEPCGRSNTDVKEAMSGNICRCGAYSNIVAAIQQVRKV